MFERIDNIKLLEIHGGLSSRHRIYRDRFSHVFIFKRNGVSEYDFGGHVLSLEAGGMLFIPKGSSYFVRRVCEEESRYVLINFDADIPNATPKLWSVDGFAQRNLVYEGLTNMWIIGGAAEKYKCMSVFYDLLSYLMILEQPQYAYPRQGHLIRPALDYLKEHLFDTNFKVKELSALCGISDTYFRQLFRAHFAVNPQEYVMNKRLEHAAAVLRSGEFVSVGQIAQEVGYNDPLYFSRIYTRRYGVCPTEYVTRNQQHMKRK